MRYRDDEFDRWLRTRLRLRLGRLQVCEHHHPPFQFFADAFYERHGQLIGMSNRTGGKSMGVGALNVAELALKKRCGIVSLAGNFAQAQRGYEHVREFFKQDEGLSSRLAAPPLQKRTTLVNGSSLEVLTASERSVHSPHVPKLRIDEVDLVPYDVYQGALSIPISTRWARATVVMTSTRFKAYGLMYNLVEQAPEKGVPVYSWCIKEVMERCPYRYDQCPMRKCEGYCDGKWCKRAQGFYTVDDIHAKYMSVDAETWRTQWLVEKPSRFGLVYDAFDPQVHVVTDEQVPPFARLGDLIQPGGAIRLDPRIRPAWNNQFDWVAGVDWGYEDPCVVLLGCRTGNDDVYVVDELYLQHASPSEVARAISERFPMLVARPYDPQWSLDHESAPVFVDPSDPASARELTMNNLLVVSRPYQIQEGISLVRRFMKPPGAERPKLFVHERCRQLRRELNAYHLKEGSDAPVDEDNHGPDALRYLMTGIFMPVTETIHRTVTWTPPDVPISPELDADIPGSLDTFTPGWGF